MCGGTEGVVAAYMGSGGSATGVGCGDVAITADGSSGGDSSSLVSGVESGSNSGMSPPYGVNSYCGRSREAILVSGVVGRVPRDTRHPSGDPGVDCRGRTVTPARVITSIGGACISAT